MPYLLLAGVVFLSAYAASYVSSMEQSRRHAEFLTDAADTRALIEVQLHTYVEVIRAGAALLAASNEIHPAELRAFVRHLELRDRYPGLDGIGFSQRVVRDNLDEFARSMDLDSGTRLRIRPPGDRAEYHPVVFVESMDGAEKVIGFDLFTDPVQHEAMERARDTGLPALSAWAGRGAPFNEPAAASAVLYTPVYRTGVPALTMEQRRRALHGFVFSPLRADILLARLAASTGRPVTFEVYDGVGDAASLIHASAARSRPAEYEWSAPLRIEGRDWRLVVKSAPRAPGLLPAAQNALTGGLLLAALLFAITLIQIRAWETAKRQEVELLESEQALRARESELRDLVAREQAARAQAQRADRAKDDFLVGVSHELRTPINAMLGWLTLLRSQSMPDEHRARALDIVERNARLQARLIEDLIDVSRIVLGKMKIDLQPLALAPLVSSVIDSVRPTASEKGVDLQAPGPMRPGMIHGDAARVTQVVWNLISNAIKFTPAGGRVVVELGGDERTVELRVRDTGVGIGPEFLPHVFERFRQAESSAARAQSGLGLGLSIARHLVQLHGGSVEAHSEGLGRGSLFVVRFPAAARERDQTPADAAGKLRPLDAGVMTRRADVPGGGNSLTA